MKKNLYSYIYCNVKIKGQCTQNMYKKKNHNHIIEIIKTKMQQSFDCFSKLFIIKNLTLYRKKEHKKATMLEILKKIWIS